MRPISMPHMTGRWHFFRASTSDDSSSSPLPLTAPSEPRSKGVGDGHSPWRPSRCAAGGWSFSRESPESRRRVGSVRKAGRPREPLDVDGWFQCGTDGVDPGHPDQHHVPLPGRSLRPVMTPAERDQLAALLDRLNMAAEEFRASRDAVRTALLALVEANDAQARSIDHVIAANVIVIDL